MLERLIPLKGMTDDQRLRAIIIAALLRCIYGAMEYAPAGRLGTRESMIEEVIASFTKSLELLLNGYLVKKVRDDKKNNTAVLIIRMVRLQYCSEILEDNIISASEQTR